MCTRIPRIGLIGLLILTAGFALNAEELTTVAVFSSEEVILTFYQDSDAYRDYSREAAAFQDQYDEELDHLAELRAQRADAIDRNQNSRVQDLNQRIEDQINYINDIYARWSIREEELSEGLTNDEFTATLYEAVKFVMENEGYTAVFDLNATEFPIPFVHAAEINITQQVTEQLIALYR